MCLGSLFIFFPIYIFISCFWHRQTQPPPMLPHITHQLCVSHACIQTTLPKPPTTEAPVLLIQLKFYMLFPVPPFPLVLSPFPYLLIFPTRSLSGVNRKLQCIKFTTYFHLSRQHPLRYSATFPHIFLIMIMLHRYVRTDFFRPELDQVKSS